MVHYSPSEKNSGKVGDNGLLLIDTGGQYTDGTTDTTRTLVLGEITKEEKESLTLVLKGNIAIATLVFPNGKTGKDIDAIAREPLWKKGLDYKHGTGHGIGFFLGVHEGPQRISPVCNVEFRENMTLSDEPGVYVENSYGIRIENHLCVKKYNDEFLCFEVLNYCPIGTKGIDESLLDRDETRWLNGYNEKCCELLKPHLAKEEYEWLKTYTAKI
jgi:Xaa-Pro aminopeptidase